MYFLAQHAFACAVRDHVVILDVRHDAYCAIPPGPAHWLQRLVENWPAVASEPSHVFWPRETGILRELLGRGILTTECSNACPPPRVRVPLPVCALALGTDTVLDDSTNRFPGLVTTCRFIAACLQAKFDTEFRSLRETIASLQRGAIGSILDEPDVGRAQEVVANYRYLRPLFFGSKQRCLYHSLSLLRFLRAHGIRAGWVFGVQLEPFAAHCWLQQGTLVINDSIERVRRFTPIMAV